MYILFNGRGFQMKKFLIFSVLFMIAAAVFAAGNFGAPAKYTLITEPGDARGLEIAKGYLYCGTRKDLYVYDISNPLKPVKVGVLKNIGAARQISHKGNYLYITMRQAGIKIIDISNPTKPKVAGFYDTVEMATGIDIAGNLLFCAQRIYGVETLDISDPVNPRPVSLQRTHEAQSCIYKDKILYVGDWGASYLTVIDMKDPANPAILSQQPLDGYGDGVDVVGNYCYAATGHHSRSKDQTARHGAGHGLEIFSLDDPAKPQKLSVVKFPKFHRTGNDYWSVRVSGDTAVVVDTHNGAFVVDVKDKKNPVIKSHALFPKVMSGNQKLPACAADLVLGDNVAYIAVQGVGLAVLPVKGVTFSHPRPQFDLKISQSGKKAVPNYKRYDFNCTVRRVAIKNDTAYVACSVKGLKVLDLESGKVRQEIPVACAYDVTLDNDKLYIAAGYDGIISCKINPDMTLTQIAHNKYLFDSENKRRHAICVQMLNKFSTGNLMALSDRGAWVYFVDVTRNMKLTGRYQWIRQLYGDAMPDCDINGIVPVHCCGFGAMWFDIKGDKAVEIARDAEQKNLSGQSEGWTVLNGKFLAPSIRGYTLLDPSTCGKNFKQQRVYRKFDGTATANGNIVAFAGRVRGTVRVYDFSNEEKPVELKDFAVNVMGTCDRIRFWKDRVVVPAGLDGLLVSDKPVK